MATDTGLAAGMGEPPGAQTPGGRLRWLLTVVTVMALLTAGWPLLNSAVSDNLPLSSGAALRIGPGGPDSATLRVGPGWSLRPAESDPARGYSLRRGAATLSIAYVSLAERSEAPLLWHGLQAILRIRNPGLRLGSPGAITSTQGRAGLTGALTSRGAAGAAAIFVGPAGTFAIEMIGLAPRSAGGAAAIAAIRIFMRSLIFRAVPR
jgi:hypothetical protein